MEQRSDLLHPNLDFFGQVILLLDEVLDLVPETVVSVLVLAQVMSRSLYQGWGCPFWYFQPIVTLNPGATSELFVCCVVALASFLLLFQVDHCELSGKSPYIFVASLLGEQQQLCTCEFSSVPSNHILIWSFSSFCLTGKMPALKI